MILTKTEFKPGVVRDESALAAEGGYIGSDKMRGWRGRMQTLGGWQLQSTETFPGVARGAHAWSEGGNPLLAWGTATSLYALVGGAKVDITPPLTAGVLLNSFATVNGSAVVTVTHPLHGLATGNSITFSNANLVGGLLLNGDFIVSVTGQNTYTITASTPAIATATSGTGIPVDFFAPLPAGLVDGLAVGYGSGAFGSGPYGVSTITDTDPRTWSLDNFGENLVANPRGGGLYEWQPAFTSPELLANGDFATDTVWAKGTGWTISGGVATKAAGTASLLSQNVQNLVKEGKVYRITFTVTRTAGVLQFRMNAGTGTPAVIDVNGSSGTGASTGISLSGTYSRTFRAPAGPIDAVFSADGNFAGTIDNVSLKLESRAYRIEEAPRNIDYMFVDPNRFLITMATQETDGDYNPLLVRWCSQENNRIWIADEDNTAGEIALFSGGRAMSGLASREQNLLWTDNALFSMTFAGNASEVFSIKLLGTGCGIIGRNAATEHNGITFWMSRSGFYIFQGAIPQKIDCPNERTIFENLTELQTEKIWAAINSQFSEVWWLVPDERDGAGVECSRAIVFNLIEQHWVDHTFDYTTWLAAGIFPNPIAFSARGLIFQHEIEHSANGNPITGYLETAYFDIEDGDHLMNILRIVPDFKDQLGAVSFTLYGKPFPNGPEWTWGPYLSAPGTQKIDLRKTARQIKVRFDFAASPSFVRVGAMRLGVEKSGALR